MYEVSCARAGHPGCNGVIRAASEDELRAKVEQHVRTKHNVQVMSDTIFNFLRDTARQR